MDLHTLASRIQGLGLKAEINAYSIAEGFKGAGSKWLTISAADPCGRDRYYANDFQLFNGAPMSSDAAIEAVLETIAVKVKAYDEIDRYHALVA